MTVWAPTRRDTTPISCVSSPGALKKGEDRYCSPPFMFSTLSDPMGQLDQPTASASPNFLLTIIAMEASPVIFAAVPNES